MDFGKKIKRVMKLQRFIALFIFLNTKYNCRNQVIKVKSKGQGILGSLTKSARVAVREDSSVTACSTNRLKPCLPDRVDGTRAINVKML